ncbi:hypothetical protein HNP84_004649 [Thermocatellispora tengchongensis]|uniref:non-specific serine/threonine protein kinase n=1 Tax=Thermocatellispora tengchongensis TaxID=1073253 RepID=A0A840PFV0_9ACTN|nr:serine/threonine-protein kinase [Thermocatellispora tengchongensis]MBB5134915.1 hypothetical protein [Thermocatellispora tengchongensis]
MIGSRRLAGRYRLLNPLGEGDSGTIWLAADDVLGRDVAVKEVRLAPGLDEARRRELCEATVREANVAARLKHPSIVTIHDVIVEGGRPWVVMERLSGSSLEELVRRRGPLPPHQIARVGVSVLAALAVAHAAGVVHRDIKPGNVILTRTGRAVLTDFGIAAIEGEATLDRTVHLVGAPEYIAPERLRGEPGGPASDLWSLGATLYFGVEGRPPHHADTPVAVLSKVLVEPPRPPERAGALGPALLRLLAPEPGDRPALAEAARELEPLTAEPVAVPQQAPPPEPVPGAPFGPTRTTGATAPVPARPPRTWPIAAGIVLLLAVIAAGSALTVNVAAALTAPEPPRPRATPTPTRLSESPGRFGLPVRVCDLLTAEQVRRMLPGIEDVKGGATNREGCSWEAEGMGIEANPVTLLSGEEHWGSSPRRAHERFVNQRNATIPSGTLVWSWDDIGARLRSARNTGPEPVTGVGDEAFAYQVYDNRSHLKPEQSYIVFRLDNLVMEVGYTAIDGKLDEKALRDGARTIADWMVAALKRTG